MAFMAAMTPNFDSYILETIFTFCVYLRFKVPGRLFDHIGLEKVGGFSSHDDAAGLQDIQIGDVGSEKTCSNFSRSARVSTALIT